MGESNGMKGLINKVCGVGASHGMIRVLSCLGTNFCYHGRDECGAPLQICPAYRQIEEGR